MKRELADFKISIEVQLKCCFQENFHEESVHRCQGLIRRDINGWLETKDLQDIYTKTKTVSECSQYATFILRRKKTNFLM